MLRLVEEGTGRILVRFGDRIPDFHVHVIFARKGLVDGNPEAVREFLAAWFESVQYMRDHRDETIAIAMRVAEVSKSVATANYDELMPVFNRNGQFDAKALDVLARSFVEMGALPEKPDMSKLYTEAFLPKNDALSLNWKSTVRGLVPRIPFNAADIPRRHANRNQGVGMVSEEVAIGVRGVSHQFGEAGDQRFVRALLDTSLDVVARRAAVPHRAERLRQEHAPQRHRRAGAAERRQRRRAGQAGARAAAARNRLRVPGKRAVSVEHRAREHRARHGVSGRAASRTRACGRRWRSPPSGSPSSPIIIRRNCPAACASARRSPARSAWRPPILLMDEPFGALDEQTRMMLGEDLSVLLARSGKTIVFVTHSLGEAVFLADRVAVFSARPGTIKEIIAVDEPHPRRPEFVTSDEVRACCATGSTRCCMTRSARRCCNRASHRAGAVGAAVMAPRSRDAWLGRLVQAAFVAGLIALWYLAATRWGVSRLLLPNPVAVLHDLVDDAADRRICRRSQDHARRAGGAFSIAVAGGVTTGYLISRSPYLIRVFEPLFAGLYAIPIILFLPLFVLFFGLGPASKIAIGATIGFFPIVLNTIAGLRRCRSRLWSRRRARWGRRATICSALSCCRRRFR